MNDRLSISFKRFICELCGGRYQVAGECARCEGVRLRDLADPATRNWITSQDAMRRSQRLKSVIAAAALLALPVPFILPELVGPVGVAPELIWLAAALSSGLVLGRVFRAHTLCPDFSDAEERLLRSLQTDRAPSRLGPQQPTVSQH